MGSKWNGSFGCPPQNGDVGGYVRPLHVPWKLMNYRSRVDEYEPNEPNEPNETTGVATMDTSESRERET